MRRREGGCGLGGGRSGGEGGLLLEGRGWRGLGSEGGSRVIVSRVIVREGGREKLLL
jgi:hypothetical protein